MNKSDEFALLVRAGLLKSGYELLKKEIEVIRHPEKLLPKTTVLRLKKEKNFKKVMELLTVTHADNACMNGLAKVDDLNHCHYISFNELAIYSQNIKQFIDDLPANIAKLKQVKKELKQLIRDADNRAPRLFKTGNLKESIRECIDIEDVQKLQLFAETTRDSIVLHQQMLGYQQRQA